MDKNIPDGLQELFFQMLSLKENESIVLTVHDGNIVAELYRKDREAE